MPDDDRGPPGIVASEFASVAVSLDDDGNGTRLRVEDLRSGAVRHLDALELESLVWASDTWWRGLMDPSQHRWRDPDDGPGIESLRPGS